MLICLDIGFLVMYLRVVISVRNILISHVVPRADPGQHVYRILPNYIEHVYSPFHFSIFTPTENVQLFYCWFMTLYIKYTD